VRHFRYDEDLKKVVEYFPEKKPYGLTIIPDEKEFVSFNAFPETERWSGRRSKKAVMKKYNCIDYRDTDGVGKEKLKRIQRMRDNLNKDPWVKTEVSSISPQEVREKRERRRKTHFTGYRLVG